MNISFVKKHIFSYGENYTKLMCFFGEKNFQNLRNMMEHQGWQLDKISFEFINKSFEIKLPQVYDVDFFEYMKHIVCRLSDFVENIVLFIFQKDNAYPMFQINGNPWTISFNKEYDETWLLKV